MRNLLPLLLAAAVLQLSALPGAAQSTSPAPRTPALVAIAPELREAEMPFRIARLAGNSPRDVILLAPEADARALTSAIEALLATRRQTGELASAGDVLRVRPTSAARRSRPVLPWAERVLQDARAAAPREVPGIGRLRAVQIWLPSQR
jgi:hypothetical protein